MAVLDQLLFGYDGGHRLLSGSRPLSGAALNQLLTATDSPVQPATDRLITGLPLLNEESYALCFTWSAPEVSRPGAVWAHVLLVRFEDLDALVSPIDLRRLAERPGPTRSGKYSAKVDFTPDSSSQQDTVPAKLLDDAVAATYGLNSSHVLQCEDLAEAENCFGLIWKSQWSDLRRSYAFRTRESARVSSKAGFVVAARRIQGKRPPASPREANQLRAFAAAIRGVDQNGLIKFLSSFVPLDGRGSRAVAGLTELHEHVAAVDIDGARQSIESLYPLAEDGSGVKIRLFGEFSGESWVASPTGRLASLLHTETDAWDFAALKLESQIGTFLAGSSLADLIPDGVALPQRPYIRAALISGVVRAGRIADVSFLAHADAGMARQVLYERHEWLTDPELWRRLESDAIVELLSVMSVDDGVLDALLSVNRNPEILSLFGTERLEAWATATGAFELAADVLDELPWSDREWEDKSNRLVLMQSVVRPNEAPEHRVGAALIAGRGSPDEVWLRAACKAVANPRFDHGNVLEVVFGALHRSITENRLPLACWADLDLVLPQRADPASRLRREIVRVAHAEDWSPDRVARAVRDSGPYGSQIVGDIEKRSSKQDKQGDDWFTEVIKVIGRVFGG